VVTNSLVTVALDATAGSHYIPTCSSIEPEERTEFCDRESSHPLTHAKVHGETHYETHASVARSGPHNGKCDQCTQFEPVCFAKAIREFRSQRKTPWSTFPHTTTNHPQCVCVYVCVHVLHPAGLNVCTCVCFYSNPPTHKGKRRRAVFPTPPTTPLDGSVCVYMYCTQQS